MRDTLFKRALINVSVILTILLLPIGLREARADNPCDIFQGTKIRSCQQRQIDLFKFQLAGSTLVRSEHLRLATDRVYWACCLAGAAADRPDWAPGTFLLLTRSPDSDVEGMIGGCKHAIAPDAKWTDEIETIEGGEKPPPELWGVVLGILDQTQAGSFEFCDKTLGPLAADSQAIGKVWIISVAAKDLNQQ